MKLTSLTVDNFRALTALSLSDIANAVVLAGPNGCGKSCVLDAIRLLKSGYGSYLQDEWQNWFGEFQIDLKRDFAQLTTLFQDKDRDVRIIGKFALSDEERTFLKESAKGLFEELVWGERSTEVLMGARSGRLALTANQRANREKTRERVRRELPAILAAIDRDVLVAGVTISPNGHVETIENILLELVFSTYQPRSLGVIEFHPANRNYNRERLGNVNLTIESTEQRPKQHALYNTQNKFANLKSEMASAYVRHLLAKQADNSLPPDDSLTETLRELFGTFFPGKEFLGPQPTGDGRLLFPVRLRGGGEHDIDDLSSGEKEVLYGYLRLHNSAPRNSIIMIDEPELHLNPRLINGLASFYYRHLGQRLRNQLWLVSHSDTLIREAVGHNDFSVFHIHPTDSSSGGGQATRVQGAAEMDRLIIELIGDLAAYRPGAKLVIFESTEDAAFDLRMTCSLFPELEQQTNAISAGDRKRVQDLYELLEKARVTGCLPARFFAITDADDEVTIGGPSTRLQWDVYHIENYLLEPRVILKVLRDIGISNGVTTDEAAVLAELKSCASETVPGLILHKLRGLANKQLVSSIDLGCNPARLDAAAAIGEAIARSADRINLKVRDDLSDSRLAELEDCLKKEYATALATDVWRTRFRGREILRRFAGRFAQGLPFEYFREMIVSRMRDDGFRPSGMANVVNQILSA